MLYDAACETSIRQDLQTLIQVVGTLSLYTCIMGLHMQYQFAARCSSSLYDSRALKLYLKMFKPAPAEDIIPAQESSSEPVVKDKCIALIAAK